MAGPNETVATPCVRKCALAACHAMCTGCARTRDEIAAWAKMTQERRAEIMASLPERARWLGILPVVPGPA